MNPKPLRNRKGPEAKIQANIVKMLRFYEWFVMVTHGNMYQSGFPDLYATHSRYGARWIEVKLPEMKGSHFTPAQLDTFPKLEANGALVWVLTGATESEYKKLFARDERNQLRSNWSTYLGVFRV